jgi:hypothetical protein
MKYDGDDGDRDKHNTHDAEGLLEGVEVKHLYASHTNTSGD